MCDYLGFIFLSYCVTESSDSIRDKQIVSKFEVMYQWTYINFTWTTREEYRNAIISGAYIPENNIITAAKFYKNEIYVALPRLYSGTPATLAVMENTEKFTTNPLLKPFPNWRINNGKNCDSFQSVHSMEIDRRGVMWLLDGNRISNFTRCPPKLFLIDIKNDGVILHAFEFPEYLSSSTGGFLNDLVIDESDGGYAYITENSDHDPGLIVYSRFQNRAWKLRDRSMFAEPKASVFVANDLRNTKLINIDGIAMSPLPKRKNQERLIYYSCISSLNLFAISNRILKNEMFARGDSWRKHIRYIGAKQGQTDGLIIDNKGTFYYTLVNLYAIGEWSIYEPFITSTILEQDASIFRWPDSFGFDSKGYLYVVSNEINRFFAGLQTVNEEIKYNIARFFTGTQSYLHN